MPQQSLLTPRQADRRARANSLTTVHYAKIYTLDTACGADERGELYTEDPRQVSCTPCTRTHPWLLAWVALEAQLTRRANARRTTTPMMIAS